MSFPKVLDPLPFRVLFAQRWAEFLQEHYANPEEVAVAFGVRYQTACNWWGALNRPSGDVVARAFILHPEPMRRHFADAA